MTTAQKIADALDNHGSKFRTYLGTTIGTLCRDNKATVYFPETQVVVYEFEDESAIVVCGFTWGIRAENCSGYCWASAGCQCEKFGNATIKGELTEEAVERAKVLGVSFEPERIRVKCQQKDDQILPGPLFTQGEFQGNVAPDWVWDATKGLLWKGQVETPHEGILKWSVTLD